MILGSKNRWCSYYFYINLQGLKVVDFQMPDYLVVVERAIQFGTPVLLQNIQEELEPSLNPVLNKSLTRIGQSSTNTTRSERADMLSLSALAQCARRPLQAAGCS